MFEYDAKFRAARAIMNLTREKLSEACGLKQSVIQRLESNPEKVHSSNSEILENFFVENGIIFESNSIFVDAKKGRIIEMTDYNAISDADLIESFGDNKVFNEKFNKWTKGEKKKFISVLRSLRKSGLDLWNVNMSDGEVRGGYKGPEDEKGKPFFYFKFKDDGFTIDVNTGVSSYSSFIRGIGLQFGHGWFVDNAFAEKIEEISDKGLKLPQAIQLSCRGRLPNDYPSPYDD